METKDLLNERNPERYREFSNPFTAEEAEVAVKAFFEDVREARIKHGIRDAHLVVKVPVIGEDGVETVKMGGYHMGYAKEAPEMLALELGRCLGDEAAGLVHLIGIK